MVAGTRLRRPPAHPSPSLSSGIGKEVAATFARRGATVVLACRSPGRGEALVAELEAEAVASRAPRPSLRVARLDVADLASVRSFARSWGDNPLHALVNNAGIFVMGDAARAIRRSRFRERTAVSPGCLPTGSAPRSRFR